MNEHSEKNQNGYRTEKRDRIWTVPVNFIRRRPKKKIKLKIRLSKTSSSAKNNVPTQYIAT